MRIKYIATFAAVSILSLGLVTGCGGEGSEKTNGAPDNGNEKKENPCAGKDPCAGKENPCAGKTN
ncbi:MAG: hypothetical protein AB4426_27570 [Xenococcaceae cyanobacterium]